MSKAGNSTTISCMQRRGDIVFVFFFFFIVSLLIFFFLHKSIAGVFENLTTPLQKMTFSIFHKSGDNKTEVEKLREENNRLLTELAHEKEIEKENTALRDQFKMTNISSRKLLPAQVIGGGNDEITIDRGSGEGVKMGDAIVVKDNLIGRVGRVSQHISLVDLLTKSDTSFTAQTSKTSALGVVSGKGSEVILGNVVLSEKLEKNDIVVTKGDVDKPGKGFYPDLIVGKIISVNKKASALFQTAEIQSLVDLSRIEMVFVIIN